MPETRAYTFFLLSCALLCVEIVRPAGGAAAAVESKAVVTKAVASFPTKGDTIHTLVTSNGSPYLNFQNRIM